MQIAVYGKCYCDAGKDTVELFCNTGLKAIINDDLTNMPIHIGAFFSMLFVGGSVCCVALLTDD